MTFKVTQYHEL